MAKKNVKDTEYLFISARLRSMERNLLTAARMERMIDAPTAEDAAKVLSEIGYNEFSPASEAELSQALAAERERTFQDLYRFVPDKAVVDVFRVKYDYHNAKTVLKARAMGVDGSRLLVDAGRVPTERLAAAIEEGTLEALPPVMAGAVQEALEVLSTTGDPQRSDFILDDAYFREMLQAAEDTGSSFLKRYVQATIDAANLRAAVRAHRMGQGPAFLREVLVEGGQVEPERLAAAGPGELPGLYFRTPLEQAAELGGRAMEGGALTAFEKACDDAVTAVVRQARRVPFGEQPLVGYLYAREAELTSIRILLNGKLAGLDRATLEERLRESYA